MMTQKIPIIEQIAPKADQVAASKKSTEDGSKSFDVLLKPGADESKIPSAPKKVNPPNVLQSQKLGKKGKKVQLKAKPILDTSKIQRTPEEEALAKIFKKIKEEQNLTAPDVKVRSVPKEKDSVSSFDQVDSNREIELNQSDLIIQEIKLADPDSVEKEDVLPDSDKIGKEGEIIPGTLEVEASGEVNILDQAVAAVQALPVVEKVDLQSNVTKIEAESPDSVKIADLDKARHDIETRVKTGDAVNLSKQLAVEKEIVESQTRKKEAARRVATPDSKLTDPVIKLEENAEAVLKHETSIKSEELQKPDGVVQLTKKDIPRQDRLGTERKSGLVQNPERLAKQVAGKSNRVLNPDLKIQAQPEEKLATNPKYDLSGLNSQSKAGDQLSVDIAGINMDELEAKEAKQTVTVGQKPQGLPEKLTRAVKHTPYSEGVKIPKGTDPALKINDHSGDSLQAKKNVAELQTPREMSPEPVKDSEQLIETPEQLTMSLKQSESAEVAQVTQVAQVKPKIKSTDVKNKKITPLVAVTKQKSSKRADTFRENYGVEALKGTPVEQIEDESADVLKQQLRDRIDILKKAQESIHVSSDQSGTQNLHRTMSMRVNPLTGMVPDQANSVAHSRTQAALYARNFASEMVDKIREVVSKQPIGTNKLNVKFVVDGGAMGQLDVEFHQEFSKDQISIFVDNEVAKNDLIRILPQIEDNLHQQGFMLSGVYVEVRDNQERSESAGQQNNKQTHTHEDISSSSDQGLSDETIITTNRNYGYNTMEVLA